MKKTIDDYINIINEKKNEAHSKGWLYIELNAKNLVDELEPKVKNITTSCKALYETMLEGDGFIIKPNSKYGSTLTIRYYVDNLNPDRKKYFEVN